MKSDGGSLGSLRAAALTAAVIGGVGSVVLMLRAGLRPPLFLVVLFVIWDAAPFVALGWAIMASKRWSVPTQATLYAVTFMLTLAALALYAYRLVNPPRSTAAFLFVAVPIGSWLLMAIAVPAAALISRRRTTI